MKARCIVTTSQAKKRDVVGLHVTCGAARPWRMAARGQRGAARRRPWACSAVRQTVELHPSTAEISWPDGISMRSPVQVLVPDPSLVRT
ncbi:hypothetical protein VTN02DRAFT_4871 [Thermoascus thermophilus]